MSQGARVPPAPPLPAAATAQVARWEAFDFRRREPTEFGLFDLDRYANL